MKRNLILITTFLLHIFFMPTSFAAETFTLDPNHTYVLWHIKHFGFSTQVGKWYASGTLILDKDKPANSKVNAVIKVADIATGLPELDAHLKGKLFFDTAQYPTATFVSDKVDLVGDKAAKVHGLLTLHGVTKPVILNVTLNQSGVSPITDNPTVGFTATAAIKRSDFGINTLQPGLGDDVTLDIDAEAYQPKK
jgi:polyisoprenoid-binding protein YceI